MIAEPASGTTDAVSTGAATTDAASTNDTPGPAVASIGVLVMAYGTPRSPEDVEEYYTHIRRGRPPTDEQLADLVRRYDAIGGVSPMGRRTDEQVDAITSHLARAAGPDRYHVRLGQKHAAPFIEDGVAELAATGVTTIVGLVLAPHYSAGSVGQYHDRAGAALRDISPSARYVPIDDWSTLPAFVEFTAASLERALEDMPERTLVCFTAHSLPLRVLENDPYEARLRGSAVAITAAAGIGDTRTTTTAWQSAGRTPEPWAGPDVLEVIARVGDDPDLDGLLVVPQGFTSDHLEILHDLDIEARTAADRVGLHFARTDTINDDPSVMAGLAGLIEEAAR